MKRRILGILTVIIAAGVLMPAAYAATENELRTKLEHTVSGYTAADFCDDFDGDGDIEMLAFVGTVWYGDEYTPTFFDGDLWFVSENDIHRVDDGVTGGLGILLDGSGSPYCIYQDGRKMLVYYHIWGNGQTVTTVCSVNGDDTKTATMNGYLEQQGNDFIVGASAYDCIIDKSDFDAGYFSGSGRSWRDYWYYYDSTVGDFREYGAVPITLEQFSQLSGAEDILALTSDAFIYNILYRANGYIHINMISSFDDESYSCTNILAGYGGGSVWAIADEYADYPPYIRSGLYLSALTPERAVYPEFKVDSEDIRVLLNGGELSFDQPPMIIGGRTMVPIRAIFEAMGYSVYWSGDTQTAIAMRNADSITVQLGSSDISYTLSGQTGVYTCDTEPQIISERILVPVRAIAECAGCSVEWDENTRTVIIE